MTTNPVVGNLDSGQIFVEAIRSMVGVYVTTSEELSIFPDYPKCVQVDHIDFIGNNGKRHQLQKHLFILPIAGSIFSVKVYYFLYYDRDENTLYYSVPLGKRSQETVRDAE